MLTISHSIIVSCSVASFVCEHLTEPAGDAVKQSRGCDHSAATVLPTDVLCGSAASAASVAGAATSAAAAADDADNNGSKVFPVSIKVMSETRKQIKLETRDQSDSDSESESDSEIESDEESSSVDNATGELVSGGKQYLGSTLLTLDTIECKIGNKRYRFNKTKGFVEV